MAFPTIPAALTIAGSDSGGGAGLQADLKTFSACGVHGLTVVTCLTAQNPRGVQAVHPSPAGFVTRQLQALFEELPPRAVKTGMLYSAPIITAVHEFLAALPPQKRPPLVVDPVMVATSGALLLKPSAIARLKQLFVLAALITPNLDEAQVLLGRPLRSVEDLRRAARELHERFGCAVLVKGGHLRQLREAVDIFCHGREELLLSAPFVRRVSTHGTGCTYSAAIAAQLALGRKLPAAVAAAKQFITAAIAHSQRVAGHQVLGWSEG